jgi:hypothetical protein
MRKPPGHWTPEEDRMVKSGSLAKRSVADVAKTLNRLEKSVVIRAIVIGFPFAEGGNA